MEEVDRGCSTSAPAPDAGLDQPSDEELVRRLKRRDKLAMAEFLRKHGTKMYGVAMQLMRNETQAQEVVQDALIMVWNKIGTFEGRSTLTTWLYRVTANAALMALRKTRTTRERVPIEELAVRNRAEEQDDTRYRPDAMLDRSEIEAVVHRAIGSLTEPYRTTVLLADVDELPMADIAEIMRVSEPAVKSRLHRARLALRNKLKPYLDGSSPQPVRFTTPHPSRQQSPSCFGLARMRSHAWSFSATKASC